MKVILTIALALALPSTSAAQDTAWPMITTTGPATDGLLLATVDAADNWWAGHGRYPCPATVLMSDDTTADAWGYRPGCTIIVSQQWWAQVRHSLTEGRLAAVLGLQAACAVLIHERGHNLGFDHADTGVMRPGADRYNPPGECVRWAASVAPASHRKSRRQPRSRNRSRVRHAGRQ